MHRIIIFVFALAVPAAARDFGFLYPDMPYREAAFGAVVPAPDSVVYRYSVTDEMRTAAGKWLYSIKTDTLNGMPGKDTLTLDDIINDIIRDTKTRFFYWDVDGDGTDEYVDNGLDASWSHYVRIFKIREGAFVRYAELPGYLQGAFTSDGTPPVLITSRGFCCGDPVGWVDENVPDTSGKLSYAVARSFTSDVNMIYPDLPLPHRNAAVRRKTSLLTLADADAGKPLAYLSPGARVTVTGTRRVGKGWVFCILRNQAGLVRVPGDEIPGKTESWIGWMREDTLE